MSHRRTCWPPRSCRPTATSIPASRHPGDRHGCAHARRPHLRAHQGHVDHRRRPAVHHRAHVSRDGDGDIECEMVVNAAGMWGMEVGRMAGVRIPAVAVEHQYVLSGPIDGYTPVELRADADDARPRSPRVLQARRPGSADRRLRARHRCRSATTASRRRSSGSCSTRTSTASRSSPSWPHKRTPVIEQAGIRTLINGPIPYSADADFVMGKVPELDNYYVATGFLYGIAAGGGAGKMMAEWILEGRPSLDLWPLDVRRFAFHHTTHHFMGPRMVELYAHHYKLAAPGYRERHVARHPAQPAARHAGRAAVPCSARAADGSDRTGSPRPASRRSTGRRSPSRTGSSTSADEHRAVRERVGLDRPDVVRQVRDHRARRARRGAVAVGRRHGQAASAPSPTPSCATSAAASSATSR